MTDEREQVKKAYPGTVWRDRVNRMTDEQVKAIYIRLKANGKLGR